MCGDGSSWSYRWKRRLRSRQYSVQVSGGLGVAEPGDGEPCPFRADALAPGRPALDDRQLPGSDVALDADLVAGVRGDALLAPAAHAGYVQLGQSGHRVSFPGGG